MEEMRRRDEGRRREVWWIEKGHVSRKEAEKRREETRKREEVV